MQRAIMLIGTSAVDELVELMKKKDQLGIDETVKKAMDRVRKMKAMAETDGQKAERLLMEACDFIAATLPKDIEPRAWKHLLIYAPKDKSDAPI